MLERASKTVLAAAIAILAAVAGCRSAPPLCPPGLQDTIVQPACRPVEPTLVFPKVDEAIAALAGTDVAALREYCVLTDAECRCRAAVFSPAASRRKIDLLIAADAVTDDRGHCNPQAMLQRDLAAIQVEELRNRSAAEAMDAFFALLDIEQEAIGLELGLKETKTMIDYVDTLKARQVVVTIDESLPARRRLELLQRRAQIDLLRARTNYRLKFLLGWDLAGKGCIWPSSDLDVAGQKIGLNEACAAGLAHRHDLIQLRLLAGRVCSDTLPVVRAVLAQTDGSPMVMPASFWELKSDRDLYLRKEQIEHLLAERERSAAVEIGDAVAAVEAQLQRMSAALKKVKTWQDRVAELKRQEAGGKATVLDAGLARLDSIDARTEFLREVVAWKHSLARLAAVQGRLVEDCPCVQAAGGAVADATDQAKPQGAIPPPQVVLRKSMHSLDNLGQL